MADGIKVRILGDDSDLQKTLTDSAKSVAKWGAAAAAAAAVASVAITKSTATSAREIKNLSRLIGSSTADFQKMAAGAKTVGIEQDKLADIFKDVSDKVGDFLQTGAGPLADFFENIAPKVGVTADQFKNLSGPQAMQAYVDALEKANVSQSEMTFYMEAIASDASLLTPLLINGSAGFKKIGEEAEKAGAVLSDIDIIQLENFNKAMDSAALVVKGFTNELGRKLAPLLESGLKQFVDWSDEMGGLDEVANIAIDSVVAGLDGLMDSFDKLALPIMKIESTMLGLKETWAIVDAFIGDTTAKQVNAIKAEIKALDEQIAIIENSENNGGQGRLAKIVEQSRIAAETEKKIQEEVDKEQEEVAIAKIDTELMRESEKFKKLLEIEKAYQESQKEGLDAFNENNLRTAAEYAAATEKLEEASNARKLGLASSMFGNLSTLMQTENKKLFQVGKVAALSQAVIDGYSAVLSSYKEGTKIGGPVVGAAFAATAGIATAVQISKIGSASYGGGGSTAGGMGGSNPDVPQQQTQQAQQPAQDRTVRIEGFDSGQLFTGDQLNSLAEKLVEYQDDGFRLVV